MLNKLKFVVIVCFLLNYGYAQDLKEGYINELCNLTKNFGMHIIVPIKSGTEKIYICSTNSTLHDEIYNQYYEDISFCVFLNKVLSYEIKIDAESFNHYYCSFENDNIYQDYLAKGLRYIRKKYLKRESPIEYKIKNKKVQFNCSLINIMFNNNYFVILDDYSGELSFIKSLYSPPFIED